MKIILTIPNEKLEEFRAGFLAICPVPKVENPEAEHYQEMLPEFTDDEWFVEWLIREAYRAYRHGKEKTAKDTSVKKPKEILFKYKEVKK